jgi:hypothetical protein
MIDLQNCINLFPKARLIGTANVVNQATALFQDLNAETVGVLISGAVDTTTADPVLQLELSADNGASFSSDLSFGLISIDPSTGNISNSNGTAASAATLAAPFGTIAVAQRPKSVMLAINQFSTSKPSTWLGMYTGRLTNQQVGFPYGFVAATTVFNSLRISLSDANVFSALIRIYDLSRPLP